MTEITIRFEFLKTHPEALKRVLVSASKFLIPLVLITIFLLTGLKPNFSRVSFAYASLTGSPWPSDIAQDFVGFRRLVDGRELYPVLTTAVSELEIYPDWQPIRSTHPPTAFLLTAPIAFLPWNLSATIWAWFTVLLFAVAFWAVGARWFWAALMAFILLLWFPAAYSLGQLTAIWMTGIALAYRFRHRPLLAGVLIGIAALPKFMPVLVLVPFLLNRQFRAVVGFALVWLVSMGGILALCPSAITQYLSANVDNALYIAHLNTNGSLLFILPERLGNAGWFLVGTFLVSVAWLGRRDVWNLAAYFSVALLPLVWPYSLLPLMPILYTVPRQSFWVRLCFWLAILLPVFPLASGASDAPNLALAILLFGFGIALSGVNSAPGSMVLVPHDHAQRPLGEITA